MAEEDNSNEAAGEGQGKGKKPLILGALALVVILAGAGAAWWFLMAGGSASEAEGKEAKQEAPAPAPAAGSQGTEIMKLEGFVVNLARSDRARYLKTTVQLEVSGKKTVTKAEEMKPQMRDALIILLSNQSVKAISSQQGKYELKRQIVARLNNLLGRGAVRNAYFTEFVVQ